VNRMGAQLPICATSIMFITIAWEVDEDKLYIGKLGWDSDLVSKGRALSFCGIVKSLVWSIEYRVSGIISFFSHVISPSLTSNCALSNSRQC
jgi:hypothetical protein